jgi:signal transduction histidine kinase
MSFLKRDPYLTTNLKEEWQLEPNLPLFQGVGADLIQVFGNVLRNAVEAMESQEDRRLCIKTWHDMNGIHVSIKDNGPGIPETLQESIFYPFFSTKSADTAANRSVGMGIGLYHCRELVHQYGGEIRVQSKSGEGATFSIHLPDIIQKTRCGCGE